MAIRMTKAFANGGLGPGGVVVGEEPVDGAGDGLPEGRELEVRVEAPELGIGGRLLVLPIRLGRVIDELALPSPAC